ncbi:MAG TPA: DNA gyrase modulator, partial [Polyangiaceae bacterium]
MPSDAPLHAALAWLRTQPDVRYAEVRLVDDGGERLRVRDGRPEQVTVEATLGVGIRVLTKTWGFACSADTSEAALLAAARRALSIARASSTVTRAPVPFPEQPAAR